jgi:streptogramin lyase
MARRWLLLVVLAALSAGVTGGAAAATGAGKVSIYPGINSPTGIAAGSDGALWFANLLQGSIGRITTSVTPPVFGVTPASAFSPTGSSRASHRTRVFRRV